MIDTQWEFLKESQSKSESYLDVLLKHFLSNVELNITHVHFRYQDLTTIPNHPFACGVTLEKLSIFNVTSTTQQQQQQQQQQQSNKEDANANSTAPSKLVAHDDANDNDDGDTEDERQHEEINMEQSAHDTMQNAASPQSNVLDAQSFYFFFFIFFNFDGIFLKKKIVIDLKQGPSSSSSSSSRKASGTGQEVKSEDLGNDKNGQSISKKITLKNLAVYMNTWNGGGTSTPDLNSDSKPDSEPRESAAKSERLKKTLKELLNEDVKVFWNDEILTDEQLIGRMDVIPTKTIELTTTTLYCRR
ncbi:hypothetical protein RFI_24175 [Reticulomyxa filosa]|uniref:Uncharacterized protein n=1 Tax=Reticulomyxa filosa TaxID=46433 RepID=X6MH28_RETFI|nr:hypothetical protein RFI_24175 [Reticulomyxa filosa]|eukprot:ETO13199.1 hypothetical protein RFI_24175 [Reticulomyxa filosa]